LQKYTKLPILCFIYTLIILSISSCSTEKYFTDNETLLDSYNIEYKPKKDKLDSRLKLEIENYIVQKPNSNFLFIPREYIFLKNSEQGDSSWYNTWARNNLGRPPVIFDEETTKNSSLEMKNFLRNLKGYYNAEVDFLVNTKKHKSQVTYVIAPKERYKVGDIEFMSEDKEILKEIKKSHKNKLLKPNDLIDVTTFDLEKSSIALELQNLGYANFSNNYIETFGIKNDTTKTVDVYFKINAPSPDSIHRKYTVGKINIFTDGETLSPDFDTLNIGYNSYYKRTKDFIVKPTTLERTISLKTGQYARRNDKTNTSKNLYNLPTYRFINISEKIDPDFPTVINYDIILSPYKTKWVADLGANTYYSSISNLGRQFIGFSLTSQFQNRNLFGGGELYTLSAETGVEFEIKPFTQRTFNLSLQNNLKLIDYKDYLGTVGLFKNFGLISEKKIQKFRNNANTIISAGFKHTDINDGYKIDAYNASLNVKYDYTAEKSYSFTQLGFNLNNSELSPKFIENIDTNQLIIRSLAPNLLTGFLFKEFSYIYNGRKKNFGGSWSLLAFYEISGLEMHVINNLFDSNSNWKFANEFEFSKYQKFELDIRRYQFYNNRKRSLAFRLHSGIIIPYGSTTTAPFVRQFSIGGPNSLRGWLNQELGPGGNNIDINQSNSILFQKGDILIEASAEYRIDLFWILEGALFVDAGNIWNLKDDATRPNTKFTNDFYKQIAISAGWGLRFDINYFNIRFDFGYKVRNPYQDENGKYFNSTKVIFDKILGTPQIAVNYPF
jgi:outer membrane protein assembly factor BamA